MANKTIVKICFQTMVGIFSLCLWVIHGKNPAKGPSFIGKLFVLLSKDNPELFTL